MLEYVINASMSECVSSFSIVSQDMLEVEMFQYCQNDLLGFGPPRPARVILHMHSSYALLFFMFSGGKKREHCPEMG